MITSAILFTVLLFLNAFVFFLPSSEGLTTSQESSLAAAFDYLSPFAYIIDFQVVIALLASSMILETGILTWYAVNWMLRKFPGVQ